MIWAFVEKGVVREVYRRPDMHDDRHIDELFHPDVLKHMVDVTRHDPTPQEGWITTDHGRSFQPPAAT